MDRSLAGDLRPFASDLSQLACKLSKEEKFKQRDLEKKKKQEKALMREAHKKKKIKVGKGKLKRIGLASKLSSKKEKKPSTDNYSSN